MPVPLLYLPSASPKIMPMIGLKMASVTLAAGTIAMIVHSFGCICCPNCQICPAEITFEKCSSLFQSYHRLGTRSPELSQSIL